MRFYLDTCSLNRPWDDQSQMRIHLEAESVIYLLHEARLGRLEFVTSDYLLDELTENPDPVRRAKVLAQTKDATFLAPAHNSIVRRSESFEVHNIRGYDAQHLAAAEAAACNYFFTTDDRLLKRAQRAGPAIKVKVLNPADWPPP